MAGKIPADLPRRPHRTCVGCRAVRPQADLVRVVRLNEASLALGRTLAGRGAWLCQGSRSCLDLAEQTRGFTRSFRAPVSAAAIEELRSMMAAEQAS